VIERELHDSQIKRNEAEFCWFGIDSHSESVVEADEIGNYNTFVFQDYRLEIKATMAGRAKPAKFST